MVKVFHGIGSYNFELEKLDLSLKNKITPFVPPSTEEALILELKALQYHLRYVFLGTDNTLPIIIEVDLAKSQIEALLSMF